MRREHDQPRPRRVRAGGGRGGVALRGSALRGPRPLLPRRRRQLLPRLRVRLEGAPARHLAALAPRGRRRGAVPHGVPGPPAPPAPRRAARDARGVARRCTYSSPWAAARPSRAASASPPWGPPCREACSGSRGSCSGRSSSRSSSPPPGRRSPSSGSWPSSRHPALAAPPPSPSCWRSRPRPSERRRSSGPRSSRSRCFRDGPLAGPSLRPGGACCSPRPSRRPRSSAPRRCSRAPPEGGASRPRSALSYSAPPPALLEAVLPRFFGDPHTFSDTGYWGQPFYPSGSPFFLSLYLGPGGAPARRARRVARAGPPVGARRPRRAAQPRRARPARLAPRPPDGPAARAQSSSSSSRRSPSRCSPASASSARARRGARGSRSCRGSSSSRSPSPRRRRRRRSRPLSLPLIPAAGGSLARHVIATRWPLELAVTGLVALGAGLALARGGRLVALAGLLALLDLVRVNGELNPSADGHLLRPAAGGGARGRGRAPGRALPLVLLRRRSLAAAPLEPGRRRPQLGRLALLPRPPGAHAADARPRRPRRGVRHRSHGPRAGGLDPRGGRGQPGALPPAPRPAAPRQRPVGAVVPPPAGGPRLPAGRDPPRRRARVAASLRAARTRCPAPSSSRASTSFRRPRPPASPTRPSTPTRSCSGRRRPRGSWWSLDGHHPDWTAEDQSGPVPLLRAGARYRAVPTPGGDRQFTLRYRPRWRAPALALAAIGALCALALALARRR